jgi:poly(3-hydroxybutyrate) depolymerase
VWSSSAESDVLLLLSLSFPHAAAVAAMTCRFCLHLQMWNAKFWTCMTSNRCIDKSIDDVAFLSNVITNMPSLLSGIPIKPQSALSGYSNGGMVAQTLLCQRPDVANSLSAVALLGTMLGSDFAASSCQQKLPRSLPLLWAHGVQDPVLPFEAGSSSMGVKATGAGACVCEACSAADRALLLNSHGCEEVDVLHM